MTIMTFVLRHPGYLNGQYHYHNFFLSFYFPFSVDVITIATAFITLVIIALIDKCPPPLPSIPPPPPLPAHGAPGKTLTSLQRPDPRAGSGLGFVLSCFVSGSDRIMAVVRYFPLFSSLYFFVCKLLSALFVFLAFCCLCFAFSPLALIRCLLVNRFLVIAILHNILVGCGRSE